MLEAINKKFVYEDGSIYEGETVNGEPHGKGKLTFNNGSIYEGGFYYDTHEQSVGSGRMTYPDGRTAEGRWRNCEFVENK